MSPMSSVIAPQGTSCVRVTSVFQKHTFVTATEIALTTVTKLGVVSRIIIQIEPSFLKNEGLITK